MGFLQLYILSESTHTGQSSGSAKSGGKRIRRDNPIASLLTDIQTHPNPNVRTFRLQTLLFFIDRHWSILHDGLKQDVLSNLAQLVSHDDTALQSWAFMCLAAIAHDNATSPPSTSSQLQTHPTQTSTFSLPVSRSDNVWDQIWTQAIRRTSVSTVCRTASHLAHVLLTHASSFLPPHRVLAEIEAFAKDLDVQGPTFPYDSVCMFLTLCLKVANQDVRLYRMQLEDKVITWLTESWRVAEEATESKGQRGRIKSRMPNHTVSDVLLVLESICGLAKRSNVICRRTLPEGVVADVMTEHSRTAVIRDYLLYAHLPHFQPQEQFPRSSFAHDRVASGTGGDLSQSTSRERRISFFLLKSLECLADEWENGDNGGQITAERARRGLDFAVLTLYFESVLQLNGTRSNRRTIQAACRFIGLATPLLREKMWTFEERRLLLSGLETLIAIDEEVSSEDWEEAIVAPTDYTGIRRQVLSSLKSGKTTKRDAIQAERRAVQKTIFLSSDVKVPPTSHHNLLNGDFQGSRYFRTPLRHISGHSQGVGWIADVKAKQHDGS
jgi:serine-protein kinase ATM